MNIHRSPTSPCVLVVDDEPLLRSFNADLLSEAGYIVFEAGDADEALQVLQCHDEIQVVFTDVEMPGTIDGFGLAARISVQWPDIGVLVTSGRRIPHDSFAAPARCFVPKPYKPDEVVEIIEAFVGLRH